MGSSDLPSRRPRIRFRLRTLLFAVLVFAMLFWGGGLFFGWYTSVPLAPLVADFNTSSASDQVGKHEPLLTEDEVVASIESQLPTLKASERVKGIFRRIVRTRRLPKDAQLGSTPGWGYQGENYTVWWIDLDVVTGKNAGYTLRIRNTNKPVVATRAAPTLP